jgi:hypothetical protein
MNSWKWDRDRSGRSYAAPFEILARQIQRDRPGACAAQTKSQCRKTRSSTSAQWRHRGMSGSPQRHGWRGRRRLSRWSRNNPAVSFIERTSKPSPFSRTVNASGPESPSTRCGGSGRLTAHFDAVAGDRRREPMPPQQVQESRWLRVLARPNGRAVVANRSTQKAGRPPAAAGGPASHGAVHEAGTRWSSALNDRVAQALVAIGVKFAGA